MWYYVVRGCMRLLLATYVDIIAVPYFRVYFREGGYDDEMHPLPKG